MAESNVCDHLGFSDQDDEYHHCKLPKGHEGDHAVTLTWSRYYNTRETWDSFRSRRYWRKHPVQHPVRTPAWLLEATTPSFTGLGPPASS